MYIIADRITKTYESSRIGQGLKAFSSDNSDRKIDSSQIKRAVDNVSLEINDGERVGIIGANGAGKSTLLHILSGITSASSGHIDVEGRVSCIMGLGTNMRENLTGRENIYLDGDANGRSRDEIDANIGKIIEFAELGEFIDHPVRTYSTGMKSRLSFSMIAFIDPEILIIDEALSAGDHKFSVKASERMQELTKKGGITIIVSHSMPAICEMCDRCLWFDHGKMRMDGSSEEVTQAYLKWVRARQDESVFRNIERVTSRLNRLDIKIEELEVVNRKGESKNMVMVGDETIIRFAIHVDENPIESADLRLCINRSDGFLLSENTAKGDGFEVGRLKGKTRFEIPYGPIDLGLGLYEVTIELLDLGGKDEIKREVIAIANTVFKVENPTPEFGNPLIYPIIECSIDHQTDGQLIGQQ